MVNWPDEADEDEDDDDDDEEDDELELERLVEVTLDMMEQESSDVLLAAPIV